MSQSRTVLPAEWAPRDAILLTWPHAESDWRPWLDQADPTSAALAATISRYQKVLIACHDPKHSQHVLNLLAAAGAQGDRCRRYVVPSNDIWARSRPDHGLSR